MIRPRCPSTSLGGRSSQAATYSPISCLAETVSCGRCAPRRERRSRIQDPRSRRRALAEASGRLRGILGECVLTCGFRARRSWVPTEPTRASCWAVGARAAWRGRCRGGAARADRGLGECSAKSRRALREASAAPRSARCRCPCRAHRSGSLVLRAGGQAGLARLVDLLVLGPGHDVEVAAAVAAGVPADQAGVRRAGGGRPRRGPRCARRAGATAARR